MSQLMDEVREESLRTQDPSSSQHTSSTSAGSSAESSVSAQPARRPIRELRRSVRTSEDRYRLGKRRSTAQPLRASWKPAPKPPAKANAKKPPASAKSKLSRLTRGYGWRAYALPVLLVLTALVVFNTATGPIGPTENEIDQTGAGRDAAAAVESPAKPIELNIPTAELPEGGDYTKAGTGEWHTVSGKGPKVGTGGQFFTYTVEVENGIDPSSYAGDDAFAKAVEGTLSNPRSWTGGGTVSFQRVDASYPNPSFRVSLTTPETAHRPTLCGFQIRYEASCRHKEGKVDRVVINLARWVRGSLAFGPDLGGYRQYAINHEVGHALGNVHTGCPEAGAPAPVMMQQTFGVSNDYVAQLNQAEPANSTAVPADGKVCKPNSWPNP